MFKFLSDGFGMMLHFQRFGKRYETFEEPHQCQGHTFRHTTKAFASVWLSVV